MQKAIKSAIEIDKKAKIEEHLRELKKNVFKQMQAFLKQSNIIDLQNSDIIDKNRVSHNIQECIYNLYLWLVSCVKNISNSLSIPYWG